MAYNQGGLNGIEMVQGVQAPTTSAVDAVKLFTQNDYDPTKANYTNNQTNFLGLTSQPHLRPSKSFNWQNLNNMPDVSLGRNVFSEFEGKNLHLIS